MGLDSCGLRIGTEFLPSGIWFYPISRQECFEKLRVRSEGYTRECAYKLLAPVDTLPPTKLASPVQQLWGRWVVIKPKFWKIGDS